MIGFGFSVFTQAILGLGGGFRGSALNLDFTSGNRTLDPRVTFSRTTNATLTNSAGLVAYAPHNLLTFSEQFDNAAWGKDGATIAANAITAPDGTTTADKINETATTAAHVVYPTVALLATAAQYTASIYVQAAERTFARLDLVTGSYGLGSSVNVNLGTGVATIRNYGGTTGTTASVTEVGNGWFRLSLTVTATAASYFFQAGPAASSTATGYAGTAGSGIYVWGAQLELGSTATAYNPTTVKNLLGFTEHFDNAAWTKSNAFVQTNLLTYSQEFGNTAEWSSTATVDANTSVAPDGSTTADTLTDGNSGAYLDTRSGLKTVAANSTLTASCYIRKTTGSLTSYPGIAMLFSGGTAKVVYVILDTTVGTALISADSTTASNSVSVVDAGDYWRVSATATDNGANTNVRAILYPALSVNGTALSTAATGSAVFWGAQLVQGTSAGDYKATYAAAAAVGYTDIYGQPFAQKLVPDATSNNHWVFQSVTTTADPYTATVYMKAGEYSWGLLRLRDSVGDRFAWFNLATGVVGTVQTNLTATITSVGNGWYRCSATIASAIAGTNPVVIGAVSADNTTSYTGDGTSGIYIFGAQLSDSASVDPYVYQPVAAPSSVAYYGPRFDYDPVTLAPKGLLIEEQRTNLLLNSAVLNTQVVTTTATAHTLSFYGTGTIVLSGSSTGTVVGTGAYPTRTTLTFTPIVGVLTVTVTGSVTMAQLEAGAFATSYIPTVASQVTRAADSASMIGNNFARWYNATQGTLFAQFDTPAAGNRPVLSVGDGTANNMIQLRTEATDPYFRVTTGGVAQVGLDIGTVAANTTYKMTGAYEANNFSACINAGTVGSDASGTVPVVTRMLLGSDQAGSYLNGHISRAAAYGRVLAATEQQGVTA